MDRYPLRISVPRSEAARSSIPLSRHTAYVVELDDCGRTYTRNRRYRNFAWLHGELRRRDLQCALPELPPRKAMGNLDPAFVERRRRALEEYLVALLKLPPVIQDDTLWAFLDADMATAVVPRFICRLPSSQAAADSLKNLERVLSRETNIFRFCSPAVLADLVCFAQAEAVEPCDSGHMSQPSQQLQARLAARHSFCVVLQHLIPHERARQGLVEAGMFAALLALLWRVTEDCEAAVAADAHDQDVYRTACTSVTDCLQRLLDGSRGVALLSFCQQDDGLGALKRLASADTHSLHSVAASLIWHGLQNAGVVDALVGASARGLPLLGKLLQSPDLRARVLGSLCIACVLRQDSTLDSDTRDHCLNALLPLSEDLDRAEATVIEQAAAASLEPSASTTPSPADVQTAVAHRAKNGPGKRHLVPNGLPPTPAPAMSHVDAAPPAGAGHPAGPKLEHDPTLVGLLRSLCSPAELPRLQALLGDLDSVAEVDTVVAGVVAILDHFAQQNARDQRLAELGPVVPQLQRLVDLDDEVLTPDGWYATVDGLNALEGQGSAGSLLSDVRVRAARILVRLTWAPGGDLQGGEPPAIAAFCRRARVLEIMNQHAEVCQAMATTRHQDAGEFGRGQAQHVQEGGLADAPCLVEVRLQEFGSHISCLHRQRQDLGTEVETAWRAAEANSVSLEQRRLKHGILAGEVAELCRALHEQSSEDVRSHEARQHVRAAEENFRTIAIQVEAVRMRAREAEALARDGAVRVRDAEGRAAAQASREAELADLCHSAPAQVERLQGHLLETQRHRAALAERGHRLAAEAERLERRGAGLREQEREAAAALKSLEIVQTELRAFHGTLNSELILSEEEVARLREFDLHMQPARPSRLACDSDKEEADVPSAASEEIHGRSRRQNSESPERPSDVRVDSPPAWDDAGAEQEFRSSLHFRSFSKLLRERERLWHTESRWIRALLAALEADNAQLTQQRAVQDQEEQAAREHEEHLRQEIVALEDYEGHIVRHEAAAVAAAEAREIARVAASEAAEAEGARQLAETRLEQGQAEVREAEEEVVRLREASAEESARSLRSRRDMEARTHELETKTRTFLEESCSIALDERRLALLQNRVSRCLCREASSRAQLREEIHRLIDELRELDTQLDVPDSNDCAPDGDY